MQCLLKGMKSMKSLGCAALSHKKEKNKMRRGAKSRIVCKLDDVAAFGSHREWPS